jgi:molybdopterin-guanine dinucleotide biosynthesis protein A
MRQDESPPVAGLILAGGCARRMGGIDKALAEVGGAPIAVRLLDLLEPRTVERWIAAGSAAPYRAVAAGHGARVVLDRRPGEGPLAGLEAGLLAVGAPRVIVLAGDLALLTGAVLDRILSAGRDVGSPGGPEVLIPVAAGRRQPLAAVYARALAPRVTEALDRGVRSMDGFLETGVDVREVGAEGLLLSPSDADAFLNVNDPSDLERARRRAGHGDGGGGLKG